MDRETEVSKHLKVKMQSRIQLNSKTYQIDVFKNMPTTEANKRYALKIERLTVPPMSGGLILNQPLFSVERRLIVNAEHMEYDFNQEKK